MNFLPQHEAGARPVPRRAERVAVGPARRLEPEGPRLATPRVLVVHLSIGGGHSRAAETAARAIRALHRRAEVAVLDVQDVASPLFKAIYHDGYLGLVRSAPRLWGALYSAGSSVGRGTAVPKWLRPRCVGRLAAVVRAFAPDVVLATAAPVSALFSHLSQTGVLPARIAALITDYHAHPSHVLPAVDRYLVANTRVAAGLRRLGVPSGRVSVTGIPIDAGFQTPRDPGLARRALGLVGDDPVLLVMGGALGSGNIARTIRALDALPSRCQIVAVAGSNRELEERLRALKAAGRPRLHVFGFSTMIPELMAAADLLITKPGGISTTEALACGLPMIFMDSLHGQEARNEQFFLKTGCAVAVRTRRHLATTVVRLLDDPERRARMSQCARAMARVDAAEAVARSVLDLAAASESAPRAI